MCVSATFDVAGVASILPFLTILSKPTLVETNTYVRWVYDASGLKDIDRFLLAMGLASFAMLPFSAAVRSTTLYAQSMVVGMQRHNLSRQLLSAYLAQPYEFFLGRHSAEMGRNVLSEVDQFVDRALLPLITLISSSFVLAAMALVLLVVDPISAVTIGGLLCCAYSLIFLVVRPRLSSLGEQRLEANRLRFTISNEAFTGIKTLKIMGGEEGFVERFNLPSEVFAHNIVKSTVISQLPKVIVETLAFGGILLMALVLLVRNGGVSGGGLAAALPVLGVYALGGYRMLPAIQSIYNSGTQLRFAGPAIATIHRELQLSRTTEQFEQSAGVTLPFTNALTLEHVTYKYPGQKTAALTDINLTISRGTRIGIVGTTGAGKTTLVDIILGLLEPTSGRILTDGTTITRQNWNEWHRSLAYVPQDIFLTDGTLSQNIAFGLPTNQIDVARVEACAKIAHIHEFITTELPRGYQTSIGERGIRLSGGQKQRIGIARALYRDPDIIVFDEATSAIDNITELDVMNALDTMLRDKTVILVAHRLSTVRNCDRIAVMNSGTLADVGSWDELMARSPIFQSLVRAS